MPNYVEIVPKKRVPVSLDKEVDFNRTGCRVLWKFRMSDGSMYATFDPKKGFKMANEMMRGL